MFLVLLLTACGPLFDHQKEVRSRRPQDSTSQTDSLSSNNVHLQAWLSGDQTDCQLSFDQLDLCVSYVWERPLVFGNDQGDRILYFRVWSPDSVATASLDELPRVQVDMPEGCCLHAPPQVEIFNPPEGSALSGVYYKTTGIYFLKSGLYELRIRLYANQSKQLVIHGFQVD